MNTFSVPADRTDALPADSIVASPAGVSCREPARHLVGAVRRDPSLRIAEDRLDKVISDLEAKAKKAEADGDPRGAAIYRERRDAAAACRTPEHRSRLHSAADQYLKDLDAADAIGGCFFDAMGQAQRR
jgi:hypothetical protein